MKKYKNGFVASSWDLLHVGHIRLLKDSKNICEHLIVGLHVDASIERKEKNKPIQTVTERYEQLKACRYVDEVIVYSTEEDLLHILKTSSIDVRILGSDYKGKSFTGKELNIPVYYHDRNHNYSSTELRKRIYNIEKEKHE